MKNSLSTGDVIEVTTERLAYGGDAVARHEGLAVFIAFAAPGERLLVRITERKKNFARATIEEILAPSPARRSPPCRHFGDCGGCQLQHLDYQAQLEAKSEFVRDALARIGRIDWPHKIEVRFASELGYRGRAQVKLEPVATSKGKRDIRIGFNRLRSHSVCDVEDCPVLVPELNAALAALRSSLKPGEGGAKSSEAKSLFAEIEVAAGNADVSFDPTPEGFFGGAIKRQVSGAVYHFTPATFFQVNPLLLEALVSEATAGASGKLAMDLYAGVGLFTVQLARSFDRVLGVEADAVAARFARKNISANGASNIEFYNRRVEQWLENFTSQREGARSPAPDLILLDPPRSGAADAIEMIAKLKPARINYVSCDPATLARDLREMRGAGYEIASLTAFDLFPQTYHVETVASLIRR